VIRVLIASSSPLARAGLESVLSSDANIEVIARDSEDPDVIVADWDRPGEDVPQELLELGPDSSLVLLVSGPQLLTTLELLRSGVRAVLPRDSSPAQILAAIHAAAVGLVTMNAEDLEPWLGYSKPARLVEPLTVRETEVLGMLAEGLSNKLIAHRLEISEHTVKFHITSILSKLNASSRTEAVTLGIRAGLIML
jgi:NarL family two-component system response regulator YdfI